MFEAKGKFRAGNRATITELLLGHAELLSKAGSLAAPLASPLRNLAPLRIAGERLTGIDRRRRLPPFAGKSFSAMLDERDTGETRPQVAAARREASGPRPKAAFFWDMYANYHDPGLAQTIDNLLRAHGVEVSYPEQKGSAIPEMLYGFGEAARRKAAHNVRGVLPHVKDGALLVTGEPTASFAFKVHYADYLSSADCSLVANATRDLGEFLATLRADHPNLALSPAEMGLRAAYHQPCHLKAQSIGTPFLELLREIPGMDVTDLDAGCCGMAGTFGLKAGTYDFSMRVGAPLFARAAEVGADILVSECSTCRMQLEQATGLDSVHPAQLLARAYGL
jgi:glycerol-3-phosphate dehydrogenase subunit C